MATKKGKQHRNRNKKSARRVKAKQTVRLARGTQEQPRLAFSALEESFFAAGAALCSEHAAARRELELAPVPERKQTWWRRLWARASTTPALD